MTETDHPALETIPEARVAKALGMTVEYFRRQRPELEAAGLPPPVFPCPDRPSARNRRWSPAAVQAWIDRQVRPEIATTPEEAARADRRRRLEQRIGLAGVHTLAD